MRLGSLGSKPGNWYYPLFLCLLGAYSNLVTYGYSYPAGPDLNFDLPMARWLMNPSLYPTDPIRGSFARHASLFWRMVAAMSKHWSMEHVLFFLFVLAKLIFFLAIGRLIATCVGNRLLGACIVVVLALSPAFGSATPIGGTIILPNTSEQGTLGLPILLLAGVFLVEGRWLTATVIAGAAVYIDAIQFLHTLPAFAVFAVLDWRERKRRIVAAALVGAGIFAPWFIHFHRSLAVSFPKGYVSTLLYFYPYHTTLRWTSFSSLAEVGIIIVSMCVMGFIGEKRRLLHRETRLEILAGSYLALLLTGIVVDKFFLSPESARLMLLRTDAFLLVYAILAILIYGVNLTASVKTFQPITVMMVLSAILLSVKPYFSFLFLFMLVMWIDPKERAERFLLTIFGWFNWPSATRIVVAWCCLAVLAKGAIRDPFHSIPELLQGGSSGILAKDIFSVPSVGRLYNFTIPPTSEEIEFYQAQLWARDNTPVDSRFLVPPGAGGFRVLSERSSWGEFTDGNAMYFDPSFATKFLTRILAIHKPIAAQGLNVAALLREYYERLSWEQIRGIATRNNLNYIVQYREIKYPKSPVFQNGCFAIYNVSP